MYVNNAVVVGNLTGEPRINGGENKVTNFRMAVNRWRRPSEAEAGEAKERTEFVDVECWGQQAEHVYNSLGRGDRAIVAGELRHDRWTDEEGNPRSRLRIKAHAVGKSLEFQEFAPLEECSG